MHLCAGKNNFMINIINHTKVHSGLYLLMQTGEQKKKSMKQVMLKPKRKVFIRITFTSLYNLRY